MKNGRTNFETLIWGVQHIAENHGFRSVIDWEEDGEVAICGNNVPTLSDVNFLCEDVGIPNEYISTNDYGIDVYIPEEWYETTARDVFDGECFWMRINN